MATRKARTRRPARRRSSSKAAPPPSRLRRTLAWASRPARVAITASLMGLVVAEAAWNAGPGSWRKTAR